MACGLAVLLSIDVLAMGLRRPPLIALPLLVTLSVPVSILRDAIALPVFVGTALLFLRLLATENLDRFRGWAAGRSASAGCDQRGRRQPVLTTMWQVSIAAVLVALLAAPLVPGRPTCSTATGRRGDRQRRGRRYQLTVGEPVHPAAPRPGREDPHPAGVRRDEGALHVVPAHHRARPVHQRRVAPLAPRPARAERRRRHLPQPAGPGSPGDRRHEDDVVARSSRPSFSTTWLPLPYPIRELDVARQLALRLAHPRRRLRRRRAAAGAELHRHRVHPAITADAARRTVAGARRDPRADDPGPRRPARR